jgi:alkylation response protein AidB-like acyl-CoA dehydrogenase
MHFGFSDEQTQFRAVIARFLATESPMASVRADMALTSGFRTPLWHAVANELGLTGIHVSEALGGQGFGVEELCIVQEEFGRALLCSPYFGSTVLATTALLASGDNRALSDFLPALLSGTEIATLAWLEEGADPLGEICRTRLRRTAQGSVVDGVKRFVLDGQQATLVLLVAADERGERQLCAVTPGASGLTRVPLETLDSTRRLAELRFDACPVREIGSGRTFAPAFARVRDVALVALAAETVGCARALLDISVDYAKLRMQFGRPIGAFQSIKHKLADMLLDVELATAAVRYAAAALDHHEPEASALAAQAKAMAADTGMRVGTEAIQIHGGIGFTWDADIHLWFKRLKSNEVLFGDAACHRERYLAALESLE